MISEKENCIDLTNTNFPSSLPLILPKLNIPNNALLISKPKLRKY